MKKKFLLWKKTAPVYMNLTPNVLNSLFSQKTSIAKVIRIYKTSTNIMHLIK